MKTQTYDTLQQRLPMPSYLKTEWFRFGVGLASWIVALILCFMIPSDPEMNALPYDEALSYVARPLSWGLSGLIWFFSSIVSHNAACSEVLEKRTEVLATELDDIRIEHKELILKLKEEGKI
jgi:hypothetical protein